MDTEKRSHMVYGLTKKGLTLNQKSDLKREVWLPPPNQQYTPFLGIHVYRKYRLKIKIATCPISVTDLKAVNWGKKSLHLRT